MNSEWLPRMLLRGASLLAPRDQRADWLAGWRSELWYIPPSAATLFCLGSFHDALWLRRNSFHHEGRTRLYPESPWLCLALLSILAALSLLIAVRMPGPQLGPRPSHLSARDLPAGCIGMLTISILAFPAVWMAMRSGAGHHSIPWPGRLHQMFFLGMKLTLLQPILFGVFVVALPFCTIPIANLGLSAFWILAFRWVVTDQQRRCPVCLRLLTDPIRIGTPSHTFLEWYGSERTCSRGHGLLHVSESPQHSEWLRLDDSWSELFPEAAGARRR